jgi:ABC-type amino acid transport substrate-binding protein
LHLSLASAIATAISQAFKSVKLIGVPIATSSALRVVEMLRNGEVDAYSNLTHLLSLTKPNLPDWRIVPGSYMMTTFSIGYPKDRPIGDAFANKVIEEMKENGFIQKAIDGAKLKGAIVPK